MSAASQRNVEPIFVMGFIGSVNASYRVPEALQVFAHLRGLARASDASEEERGEQTEAAGEGAHLTNEETAPDSSLTSDDVFFSG